MTNKTELIVRQAALDIDESLMGTAVSQLKLDIFIDDSLKFAEQVLKNQIPVILYAQPWNKNYKNYLGKLTNKILGRYDRWDKIVQLINTLPN